MIFIIIAMFLWGTLGMFALWANVPMIDLAFYRCALASLPLLGYLFYHKQLNIYASLHDGTVNKANLKTFILILLGGICLVFNWLLLFWSFDLASITLGNTSYYIQPIFLILIGVIFFNIKSNLQQCALILFSLLGVLMTCGLFSGKLIISLSDPILLGLLAAISAALLYAFFTLISKYTNILNTAQLCLIQFIIGAVILYPFTQDVGLSQFTSAGFIYIIIIGVIHTGLAYVLYFQGVKKVSLTTVAALSYLDPIVAVISDVLFFNQQLDIIQMMGISITLLSSYFISRPQRDTDKVSTSAKAC